MRTQRDPLDQNRSLSRRDLLKNAAAVAAVAAAGGAGVTGFPAILRAEDKAGAKPLIVGTGAHTYEWVDNWGKLPDGKAYGNTHAVVESADGRIFVHNTSPKTGDTTCVFDPDGKFIKSWGDKFKGSAHGMDYRKEGSDEFLYLAPTGLHKVYKTTLDGEVVMEIDYPKDAKNAKGELCYKDAEAEKKDKDGKPVKSTKKAADFYVPTFIALAPNGDFYVADGYGSSYVHRYNIKGEYIQSWGGQGSGEGQMRTPHGIWWDDRDPANPMVLVADRSNVRLQWFTPDGKFVKLVKDELRHPCHFDIQGKDLLIPDLHGRLTIFDKDNKLICHIGDNADPAKHRGKNTTPQAETKPGTFYTPHGAMWDSKGNAFVVEWLPYGRVTKLKKVGA